jgi:hypothetical protein
LFNGNTNTRVLIKKMCVHTSGSSNIVRYYVKY